MHGQEGLAALVAEAKGKGFLGVMTLGGKISLEKWQPYGTVMNRIDFASWYILGNLVHEGTPTSGLVSGVWELRREEGTR